MSASVHTTISPRASWVPIRRAVPDPPLRRKAMTRRLPNVSAAPSSTSSVSSVEASSMQSSSYVSGLALIARVIRSISSRTCEPSL